MAKKLKKPPDGMRDCQHAAIAEVTGDTRQLLLYSADLSPRSLGFVLVVRGHGLDAGGRLLPDAVTAPRKRILDAGSRAASSVTNKKGSPAIHFYMV